MIGDMGDGKDTCCDIWQRAAQHTTIAPTTAAPVIQETAVLVELSLVERKMQTGPTRKESSDHRLVGGHSAMR